MKKLKVVTVITKKNSMECYMLKIVSHIRLLKNITKLDNVSQNEDKTNTGVCKFFIKLVPSK